MRDQLKRIFRFRSKKSYASVKRELEIRDKIYSGMNTLSDVQLDRWVKIKLELDELKCGKGAIVSIIPKKIKTN